MTVDVHNVRFYNLEPKGINVLAYEEESNLLAISRADNSIEIWNIRHSPHIERTILGTCGTVESLAWFDRRLFSGGLQGSVVEYDLFTQTPKSIHPVTSGSCWCVGVEKKRRQLAAGTEDGYINIFDITEDEIVYSKMLDRQEGRILCLVWDSSGDYVITGSLDTVRVWNVLTGHAVHRMSTGRSERKKPTIVWCLAVTTDFTIVSGDSRGVLCFWDGHSGTNISSYHSHKADILALCLDTNQQTVYCSGVDPLIATYDRIKKRGPGDRTLWVKSIQRIIHDHDVRALAFCDGKLFSGGVDGYLALSSYPPKVLHKYPPFLQPPSVETAGMGRCLLLRYTQQVEVWRLGRTAPGDLGADAEEGSLPVKLLQWQPPAAFQIKCAGLSADACWLAVSTLDRFRLYALQYNNGGKPRLSKVSVGTKESLVAHGVCFSQDSSTLAVATVSGEVCVISLSQIGASILHTYAPHSEKDLTDSIHILKLSKTGTYIVAADLSSNIVVWSDGKVHCKLPKYKCTPTAMSIQGDTDILVVVYPDHKIIEYSLAKRKFTKFSRDLEHRHPRQWLSRNFPVQNVSFDPLNNNIIVLHDDTTIFVIDKNKSLSDTEMKIPRLESPHSLNENSESNHQYPVTTQSTECAFHVIKKYKHLVYFGPLGEGEMVAVEISPMALLEKLPQPTLKQKRFGGI